MSLPPIDNPDSFDGQINSFESEINSLVETTLRNKLISEEKRIAGILKFGVGKLYGILILLLLILIGVNIFSIHQSRIQYEQIEEHIQLLLE